MTRSKAFRSLILGVQVKKFQIAFAISLLAFGANAAPITYVVEGNINLWGLNPPGTEDILLLDEASFTYSILTDTSLEPFHVLRQGPIPPQTPGPSTSAEFGLLDWMPQKAAQPLPFTNTKKGVSGRRLHRLRCGVSGRGFHR
jgi:hypothetical protein